MHTSEKSKLTSRIFFSFQDNCILIDNYKKLLQLVFSIVFVNLENILLEKLHSKFSVTAWFLSYGMDIYYITKNHGNFYGMLWFYMTT